MKMPDNETNRQRAVAAALFVSISVFGTACTMTGPASDNKNTIGGASIGALLGGVTGAAASHGNAGATVAGVVAGGLIGGLIGQQLDQRDREQRDAALVQSLQTSANDHPQHWKNPQTGNSGTVKPLSGYSKSPTAQTCRDYQETYTRNGQTFTDTARACRDANGQWKRVNT